MADKLYVIAGARVKYAPIGTVLPDENAVGVGESWGGTWIDPGDTTSPAVINITQDTYEMEIEQATAAVRSLITKESVTIEVTLAEFTGANVQLAFGGTLTTTPAGAAQVGMDEIVAGGSQSPDQYTWAVEGFWKNDDNVLLPVRFQIYIGEAILGGQLQFAKAQAAGLALKVNARADTSKAAGAQILKWQIVTAPALGS